MKIKQGYSNIKDDKYRSVFAVCSISVGTADCAGEKT
jgi:hypothetical protein